MAPWSGCVVLGDLLGQGLGIGGLKTEALALNPKPFRRMLRWTQLLEPEE